MPEERRQVESSEEGSLSRVAGSAGWSDAEDDGEVESRFGERVGIGTGFCCWGRWANAAAAGAVPPRELEYRCGEAENVVGGVGVV